MNKLESFVAWMRYQELSFHGHGWLIEIAVVMASLLFINFFVRFIYHRLQPRIAKTENFWDSAILDACYKPLQVLVWLIGLSAILQIAVSALWNVSAVVYIREARVFVMIFIIIWLVWRLIGQGEHKYITVTKHQRLDNTTIYALGKLARVVTLIIASLFLLEALGIGVSALVAFGGVSGAAVAFASKDLLANLFGGLVIFLDRPFAVGDWIRSPDRSIEGTVEYIGWRLVRIRTFDKRPLYVPCGLFTQIIVENASRMKNRRIKTNVGVRYNDAAKIGRIVESIKAMLLSHESIDNRQTIIVNLVEFAPSSLNIMIYTFTKTTDWVKFQEIQQDVFLKIIAIIEAHDAECAFPTRTLHIPEEVVVSPPMEASASSNSRWP